MKTLDFKSFHYLENGDIAFSTVDTIKTTNKLDAGVYNIGYDDYPINKITLRKSIDKETVKIHSFSDKEKIDNIIKAFFDKKTIENVKDFGFNHKLGILFYGKEGTGKSSIMKYYYTQLIDEQDAIVFFLDKTEHRLSEMWDFVIKIRQIQDNPIVIILDEMETILTETNKSKMKMILDGNLSINKSLFLASTNHIDLIPDAIKNRSSRFKYTCDIEGIQSTDEIYEILVKMLKNLFSDQEIRQFSEELKGNTIDNIKQFALDKVMNITVSLKVKKSTIGFSARS